MKIVPKWMLVFALVGIYVTGLGGIFYYYLFKRTFDDKLKQDVLERVLVKSPDMIKGLLRSPREITFDELDIIDWLRSDKRITDVIYLNGNGTIRWHKDSQYMDVPFEEFEKKVGLTTDAISQAYHSSVPKVRPVPKNVFYDIAVPLKAKGDVVIGIISLQVSRADAKNAISSAMGQYILGAAGILLVMGIVLFVFMQYMVLNPMSGLRDSIDNISAKNLEMRFRPRKDEVGEIAGSVNGLLAKIKHEFEARGDQNVERQMNEKTWWESIVKAMISKNSKVMVVDENNTVFYANFEVPSSAEGKKPHLLDIMDMQQQEVLRLVGTAIETPWEMVEGESELKGEKCFVRAVLLGSDANMARTLVVFEPKAQSAA
ncbi:MAG: methyl-accepting chemotaxis protein [Elusimicrobia bacterium]|nr:methyl-accepting chemotaxis protein [Elusimicrobiota bacterium]